MVFDKENHRYTHNGKELKSVSSWIQKFVPYFHTELIAERVANKEGCDTDFIVNKWRQKGLIATSFGTAIHEAIDYYVTYGEIIENPLIGKYVEMFAKEFAGKEVYSEVIVYDDEHAGTIDLIEVVDKGKVILHDYKTNFDLYKKHGKLLTPFETLDNMPINKYRLQLSKYKQMLENMKDVEVVGLNIWHITDKFTRIPIEPIEL